MAYARTFRSADGSEPRVFPPGVCNHFGVQCGGERPPSAVTGKFICRFASGRGLRAIAVGPELLLHWLQQRRTSPDPYTKAGLDQNSDVMQFLHARARPLGSPGPGAIHRL